MADDYIRMMIDTELLPMCVSTYSYEVCALMVIAYKAHPFSVTGRISGTGDTSVYSYRARAIFGHVFLLIKTARPRPLHYHRRYGTEVCESFFDFISIA